MNTTTELDSRLLACASFVRAGAVAADIGSDHAYLPIYLVKHGICPRAVASDINEGPVKRAKINVAVSGLSDKIDLLLADGLDKASALSPDDIIIAGMGGELIRDIIDASEYVRDPRIRLILQPMTMPEVLRAYLAENGFNIIDEKVCTAADKCYQIICAEYDGVVREYSRFELLLGHINIGRIRSGKANGDELELLRRTRIAAGRRIEGMSRAANPDTAAIEADRQLSDLCEKLMKI